MVFDGLASAIVIGIAAILVLIVTAEMAVKKSLLLADHFGFSSTFAGLTVFSVATSFPEIFAHISASAGILTGSLDYKVASATVLGANIGSDVIQQTLVLGIIVFVVGGFAFKKHFLKTAYLPMIATTLMTLILAWDGTLSRVDGIILFGSFIAYMAFLYHDENKEARKRPRKDAQVVLDSVITLGAMAVMLVSAHFLLLSSETLVALTGLGGSLIGVISLGVAAAAPEMFTAIAGLRNHSAGISLGTLIGSNITNPLVAIGGGAIISTYWVPRPLVLWDLPWETITAALLLIYLWKRKYKLGKWGGAYLIALYIIYVVLRFIYFPVD